MNLIHAAAVGAGVITDAQFFFFSSTYITVSVSTYAQMCGLPGEVNLIFICGWLYHWLPLLYQAMVATPALLELKLGTRVCYMPSGSPENLIYFSLPC